MEDQEAAAPRSVDLYVGLANVGLSNESFDLGNGIVLRKCSSHVMSHPMIAFARPPKNGLPHPPPWVPLKRGSQMADINIEMFIPRAAATRSTSPTLAGLLVALMRLKQPCVLSMPVIGLHSLCKPPSDPTTADFSSAEEANRYWFSDTQPSGLLEDATLQWVKRNWRKALMLGQSSDKFRAALFAFDAAPTLSQAASALLLLWGAIEALFSIESEIVFRLSLSIATYLHAPGEERLACARKIRKLYRARSKAAHGGANQGGNYNEELFDTQETLRALLIKSVETESVPDKDQIDSLICGVGTFGIGA
jgi:hypothetical protein